MSKSHVEELLLVYQSLFRDIGNTFPAQRDSFDKDYQTLVRLAADRGIHLFCVDLPDVGKHLDRCLSEGKFSVTGMPLTKRCPRCIMYPEFLQGLWSLIFCESGDLKGDYDVEALLLLRQVYFLAKKAKLDCPKDLVSNEVRQFLEVDLELPEPESFWENEEASYCVETYQGFSRSEIYEARALALGLELKVFLKNLDLVSGLMSAHLGPYSPSDWRFRHGPGVVSERKGSVNKYEFVNWSDRLESVFPIADCGFHNYSSWGRHLLSSREIGTTDPSSRMISVPKTLTKPRLIAAEPTEHMWCQQNIWHYFCTRVQESWMAEFIRFRDQTRNQDLCKLASETGTLATLDLSSASDRVSCHFVGQLFRSNLGLLEALRSSRTRQITQDLAHDVPAVIVLKKFSTMGSACTFPVESLGFLAIVLASVATQRRMRVTVENLRTLSSEVAVFGDDLVVPMDSRSLCCSALEVLHFKVNTAKSYWNGNFRESCGVDAYRGVDITPVYWRSPTTDDPESIVSALEVRNSFYKRGYWATAEHIASTIRRKGFPTVKVDSGVTGFAAFAGASLCGLKRRVNQYLQRDEVLVMGVSSRREISEIVDDSVLLQYFTEAPSPYTHWRGGIGQRPKLRLAPVWASTQEVVS
jgi:hypothetical protein